MTDMEQIEKAIDEFEEAVRRMTSTQLLYRDTLMNVSEWNNANEARTKLLDLIKEVKGE